MMRAVQQVVVVMALLATAFAMSARGEQCGEQAGGALCPDCLCCSKWGWCGSSRSADDYCGNGCQSQCSGCGGGVASIVTRSLFDEMLKHRNDVQCPAQGFYTYDAFITAANAFPSFATTGDLGTRKREIAAFLAQTSHETTGGSGWGYCFKEEINGGAAAGKKYYGRGPMQLSGNYNYGQAGKALSLDLLGNPDLVANDALVSFKTAFWFWMTPQSPKPSCHDVMTGQWSPSANDLAAGRLPGYGLTTNIINGGLECGGVGPDDSVADRISFYKRYCDLLGVSYGDNLDCYTQMPFGLGTTISASSPITTTSAPATSYHASD